LFVRSKAQEAKRTPFTILILQEIIIPFAITNRSKLINNKLQLRKVSLSSFRRTGKRLNSDEETATLIHSLGSRRNRGNRKNF